MMLFNPAGLVWVGRRLDQKGDGNNDDAQHDIALQACYRIAALC